MNTGLELARQVISEGRNRISLREARLNCRKELKEAAEIAGVTERTMKKWEMDCGGTDMFLFNKLCKAYQISPTHVYAGKESDLLEARAEFYRKEVMEHVVG
ncbi:hypothetical protein KIH86_03515 [Paenibacillus sp. HN-1]|uniref:hypothetical protein n=1 Tax=Paenibacillus TaxID=44249 RepID=UPI001CA9C30A|nr:MULTISPECIES: hypothetical protein [Paenibacillus]MBY9077250.1 hypothetical protein [Paenibacillus sp. CGMCC 1.18879]MBY9083297.1 hypothetical protein [Paenibacillus sinensis]